MVRRSVLAILSVGMLLLQGCGGQAPKSSAIETTSLSGQLVVADGSTIGPAGLEVVSLASSSDLGADGSFSVTATRSDRFQMQLFRSKASGSTVYIGLLDPATGLVTADVESTALALLLTNPAILLAPQEQLAEYLEEAGKGPAFKDLLANLEEAYARDAESALDPTENPAVFQALVDSMSETTTRLRALDAGIGRAGLWDNFTDLMRTPPYIEPGAGRKITLVNPRHIYYGAGIYRIDGGRRAASPIDVFRLDRIEEVFSFDWKWAWPPIDLESAFVRHEYELPDGQYQVDLLKFDLMKLGQMNDPAGLATTWNFTQACLYVIGMFAGELPIMNENLVKSLPRYLHINAEQMKDLGEAIANLDSMAFLKAYADLVLDNSEELAFWIWQDTADDAAVKFLKSAGSLAQRVSLVLKIYGLANEEVPFFVDLLAAPPVSYLWTIGDGGQERRENHAPQPRFSINPPAGVVGTEFSFDASATTDDGPPPVEFRWDFDGDGVWDTPWSRDVLARHTYAQSGAYTAILAVRDGDGLSAMAAHKVNVGGGEGSASHVIVFRDNLPWDSNATITTLEALGFMRGNGPRTYEVLRSSEMATAPLNPAEDLVIISNDQAQAFYDNYARSQVRFANFLNQGGAMLWGASDEGWAKGSMAAAGVRLPGNVIATLEYDNWNYVADPNLPLVSGLPAAMDHNYASHEGFSRLPDGTTVYLVNQRGAPTLIEFNWGRGWIIISGLPMEHQYERIYGEPDLEELLPRVIAYFTGVPLPMHATSHTPAPEGVDARPSSTGR